MLEREGKQEADGYTQAAVKEALTDEVTFRRALNKMRGEALWICGG